ncbi:MAG: hypothetical protein WDO18_20640 [Acidobacteriota bacterium]
MSEPVPAGKKMPRADMIKAALLYPEGLRIGNFADAHTPFSKEAYRVENGTFIAGVGGPKPNAPGMFTQKIILHPDVKASVAAVDEEEGIVLLWMNFGDTNSYGPGNALITFEAFKVWGGEIHAVNAFFRTFPKENPARLGGGRINNDSDRIIKGACMKFKFLALCLATFTAVVLIQAQPPEGAPGEFKGKGKGKGAPPEPTHAGLQGNLETGPRQRARHARIRDPMPTSA